jgi:hypothetical protein
MKKSYDLVWFARYRCKYSAMVLECWRGYRPTAESLHHHVLVDSQTDIPTMKHRSASIKSVKRRSKSFDLMMVTSTMDSIAACSLLLACSRRKQTFCISTSLKYEHSPVDSIEDYIWLF